MADKELSASEKQAEYIDFNGDQQILKSPLGSSAAPFWSCLSKRMEYGKKATYCKDNSSCTAIFSFNMRQWSFHSEAIFGEVPEILIENGQQL